ncbi:MAG: rod shape-determining protein MreC [Candidatus Staskawiczbacteria bacterium]|nr:rod shape-determining protein MreC [Candidatus Staskawiczbacteria bacterium]
MNGVKNISLNKKNNNSVKFLVGAVALLFCIAVLNFFSSGVRNTFYALSSPFQKTFWSAGESTSGFFASFLNAGNLNKDNQSLKNQVQQLQAELVSLQSIINGNQAQTSISQACQNNGFKLLMAGVIGLDDQDVLSINKGSADGILEDMPVINQQGALFGKVTKVYKNFSKVILISSKDSVISVKVQQPVPQVEADSAESSVVPKEINGVIKGSGKMGAYLDLVPIDDIINQGDVLVTSSLEKTFPKDLLVGTITKISKNDQNPHQQAQIQPFLNSAMDNLFVITNYKK